MVKRSFLFISLLFLVHYISTAQESKMLFDGKTLDGWAITDLEGHGKVSVKDSCIILGTGNKITGINFLKEFPVCNYEITLDAMRVEGTDFFCALTFPYKDSFCTYVIGGWRGSIVGLSNIDGYDASNNSTSQVKFFDQNRWYKIRLRVTDGFIEGWIDNEKLIDFPIGDYRLSLRMEMDLSIPLGFATYETTGALKNIKVTTIPQ